MLFRSILFLTGCVAAVCYFIPGFRGKIAGVPAIQAEAGYWVWRIILIVLALVVVFWVGIILLYVHSVQLGMRYRVLGIVFGMIPIANLVMLGIILSVTIREYHTEKKTFKRNEKRREEQICNTKYPILMVHGVFFRDFRYFNYWGRIPEELTINGARVFYGEQQSAETVEKCGKELAEKIHRICEETGAEKVNIIGHSKGGLDSRYALTIGDTAEHVASLTTINTPHRGCEFADFLLGKFGDKEKEAVAKAYNSALKKLGDVSPDFLAAVYDLTAASCKARNEVVGNAEGVYYQSIGSKMNVAGGGRFPLNLSNRFVKYFDGANDGLVGEESFPWGENFRFLTVKGKRGISHGDMIDLNRENIAEFDVREFYVQLVADLKKKGF